MPDPHDAPPASASMPPPDPGEGLIQQASAAPATTAPPASAPPGPAEPDPEPPRPSGRDTSSDPPKRKPTAGAGGGLGRRLLRGAVWGAIAIMVGTALEMWNAVDGGSNALRPLVILTAPIVGDAEWPQASPFLGAAINMGVGAVVGMLFALVTPRFASARGVLLAALLLGAAVFAADRYLLTSLLSPALELRDPVVGLASKLVMGAVLALGFVDR